MEYMKGISDKYFDLAIVDPPYGIEDKISNGGGPNTKSSVKFHNAYNENGTRWDILPDKIYFDELFRVSQNQIICGGNYFSWLPPCRGFVCWDKMMYADNFSAAEYLWTSFEIPSKIFKYCNHAGFILKPIDYKIHPTQKPVKLYKWLLKNYAKEGDKIFDSHLGSGSIAIACHDLKFDLVGCEIDKDYYEAAVKRFENHKKQLQMF